MKKLFILLLITFILVACTPKTEDTDVPEIKLNGQASMIIDQNSVFSDPGAFVDDGGRYSITVSGTVDTSVAGSYELVYSFLYDGTSYQISRNVIVQATASEPDYYQINSSNHSDDLVNINITTSAPYSFYSALEVRIYKDDALYDTELLSDGDNIFSFSNLPRGADYEVLLYSENMDEGSLIVNSTSIITFTVDELAIPSVTISNVQTSSNSITFDYLVNDDSSVISAVNSSIELSNIELDSRSSINDDNGTITYNGLLEDSEYKLIVELVYSDYSSQFQTVEESVMATTSSNDTTTVNPTLSDYSCENVAGTYECLFTVNDPDSIGYLVEVSLHNDDYSIYEQLTNLTSDLAFTFSLAALDSPLSFTFDMSYFDSDLAQYTLVSETFIYTPISTNLPSASISNEIVDENSISFDYTLTDLDSILSEVNAYIYDGTTLISSNLVIDMVSGTVTFTNLDYDKEYEYILELVYTNEDLTTDTIETSGLLTTEEEEILITDVFEVTSMETSKAIFDLDEVGYLLVTLNNPNGYPVTSVYFGSEAMSFSLDGNILKVILQTNFENVYDRNLSKIYYTKESVNTSLNSYTDFSYTVTDLSLDVIPTLIEIIPEYDFFTDVNYAGQTQLNSYVDFVFDNPEDYEIKSITLTDYSEAQWITKNQYSTNTVLRYYMTFNSTTEDFTVSSFTYVKDGIDQVVNLTDINHNKGHSEYCATKKILSQESDIIEMVQVGSYECYVMDQDLYINRFTTDWETIPNNAVISNIRLYGQGYSISGIDIEFASTVDTLTKVGLFAQLEDSYVYDLNLINVSIDLASFSSELYVGALAGHMKNSFVENVSVNGDISMLNLRGSHLGGLIGKGENNLIYNSSADVDIDGSIASAGNYDEINYIGGLIGYSSDELFRVKVIGDIDISDTSYNIYSYIGGITGLLRYGSIDQAYFGDGYYAYMDAYYSGGIVGYMDDESSVNHTFVNSTIDNSQTGIAGVNTGSIAGRNDSGSIMNSLVLLPVYGSSNNTGLFIGMNGTGEIVNSYYIDGLGTYDDDLLITASDNLITGINALDSVTAIEDSDFFINLGFAQTIWDMVTLDYHMDMPELK